MCLATAACLIRNPGSAQTSQAPGDSRVPEFEAEGAWPKPLPDKLILGQVSAVAVDRDDHVWILQRAAPPVIEFDARGNVVNHWGGPGSGYEWPTNEHGLSIDYKGNIWISGTGAKDGQILKFTPDGKFLLQIGHEGSEGGNNDVTTLWKPAEMAVDATTNEVYVADGETGNRRVIVFNAETGAYKRHWGAYGKAPDEGPVPASSKYDPDAPASRTFSSTVHSLRIGSDGLVYVCDRGNDRIQVFQKDGSFVKEAFVAKRTLGNGSTSDIAFSPDQRFMYVADGTNSKVWILQRDSLEAMGSFGQPGHDPGQFQALHLVAVDSKGNIYTAEVLGKRVQKFVLSQADRAR